MKIERSGWSPLNISEKREFTYTEEYAPGKLYPFKAGQRYNIYYWTDKTVTYEDRNGKELRRIDNFPIYDQYVNIKQNLGREKYLKPFQLFLTKKMKEQPTVTRYFSKSKFTLGIFEISEKNFSGEMTFYNTISLTWQLKGTKEHIFKVNQQTLKEKELDMDGIRDFLDPLEFYQEPLTSKDIVETNLKDLINNENIKESKKDSKKEKGGLTTVSATSPSSRTTTRTTSGTGRPGY